MRPFLSKSVRVAAACPVDGRCGLAATVVPFVTAGLLTALGATAEAQIINLSTIAAGTNGFAVNGEQAGALSQVHVAAAGDVNSDGLSDFVVSGHRTDITPFPDVGRGYVVYGKTDGTAIELSNVAAGVGGWSFEGVSSNSQAGRLITTVGDMNGDGLPDTAVSAFRETVGPLIEVGRVYVVWGKTTPGPVPLSDVAAGTGGFVIEGIAAGDRTGSALSAVGDMNGDGVPDLVVGSPFSDGPLSDVGRCHVVFGKTTTTPVFLSDVSAGMGGFEVVGEFAGNPLIGGLGSAASGVGDFNGDGVNDVVLGAAGVNRAYVIFGKSTTGSVAVSALAGQGIELNGNALMGVTGGSVSGAGDYNGDGLQDIIVGTPYGSPSVLLPLAGISHVIFGSTAPTSINLTAVAPTQGFAILGEIPQQIAGVVVSSAGDVNGDGFADILVGGPMRDAAGPTAPGRAYLILGTATPTSPTFLSSISAGIGGRAFVGEVNYDQAGSGVSAIGDVNGDGLGDIMIGSWKNDVNFTDAGRGYVIFPTSFLSAPPLSATYQQTVRAGNPAAVGIGISRFGEDRTGFVDSRAWIDFNGGSGPGPAGSSSVTATLTRTDVGITVSVPLAIVADVRWELTTDRTGDTSARVTFQYTNAEIAGLSESNLRIYRAPAVTGPWTALTAQSIDLARNQISGNTPGFSHFILIEDPVLAVDLVSFAAAAASPAAPVVITWSTAAEFDTAGFHVESAPNSTGPWTRVTTTLIPAEGSASSGATYSIVDEAPIGAGERWYRLSETVLDGTTITCDPAKASVGEAASSVGAWTLY